MDPHTSVVTTLLKCVAYDKDAHDAPVVPEADFVPFDFSYLRDFPGQGENVRRPLGGHGQNVPNALHA